VIGICAFVCCRSGVEDRGLVVRKSTTGVILFRLLLVGDEGVMLSISPTERGYMVRAFPSLPFDLCAFELSGS